MTSETSEQGWCPLIPRTVCNVSCAWWDVVNECCSVVTIARALDDINAILAAYPWRKKQGDEQP